MLLWVIRRRDAFVFLLADGDFATGSKEMTDSELELLTSISSLDSADGRKFWATCLVVQVLSDWGTLWLHGCACKHHETDKDRKHCSLKGRRAVELASGQWRGFVDNLKALSLTPAALKALSHLQDSGECEYKDFLVSSFQECKANMVMRCVQAWSFWSVLPFSLLELAKHFVDPAHPESASRERGKALLDAFDNQGSKTELGFPSWNMLGDPANRRDLKRWIKGGVLSTELRELLIGYSTSLVVMQRLEAKHHSVNLSVSRGRAQSPAAVISGLRRATNRDLCHPTFRLSLEYAIYFLLLMCLMLLYYML